MRTSAALLLSLVAAMAQQRGGFEAETETAFQGKPCPRLTLASLTGTPIELPPPSGVTVVTFFTSWCMPCRAEAAALDRYYRMHSKKGLRVIGVDAGEPVSVVKALVRKWNVAYPICVDPGTAVNAFRAYAYPSTVLVRDGQITLYKIGSYDEITRAIDATFGGR
jgi:thiol-disulfide isomerase/thioredoxin